MKKILLVADQPGWIFENHCKEIQSRISKYECDIAYHRQNIPELSKEYDLVYVLDPMPMNYPPASKTIMGLRCEFLYREHPQGAKGLYENGFPGRCVSIKDKCSIFHVVNKNLMNVFGDIVTDKPLMLAQHGINENLFDPNKTPSKTNNSHRLIVGVAGRDSRNKRFDVIKKACEKVDFQFKTASYGRNKVSKEKMPNFYSELDIYVCFSETEGLNNGLMEAGAMGVSVVSTRSGAASEMIKNGKSGYLINRDLNSLVHAFENLKDTSHRDSLAKGFQEEINNNWTWETRIKDYEAMFDKYFEMTGE